MFKLVDKKIIALFSHTMFAYLDLCSPPLTTMIHSFKRPVSCLFEFFAVAYKFSCITDVSLVLQNRQDANLKHNHNTAAQNTSPPLFTDFKS